jgi:hypothetical protein
MVCHARGHGFDPFFYFGLLICFRFDSLFISMNETILLSDTSFQINCLNFTKRFIKKTSLTAVLITLHFKTFNLVIIKLLFGKINVL